MKLIEDQVAIRALILEGAYIGDETSLDGLSEIYTEDVEFSAGGHTTTGRDALIEATRERRESGITGPTSGLRHLMSTVSIKIDGDLASSVSYVVLLITKDPAAHVSRFAGIYRDELRRTAEGWRISSRALT